MSAYNAQLNSMCVRGRNMSKSTILELIDSGELDRLAKELHELGIDLKCEFGKLSFLVRERGTGKQYWLSTTELEQYLSDPVACLAARCGVRVSHYLSWKEAYTAAHPHCWAVTKSGSPCRAIPGRKYQVPSNPGDYDPKICVLQCA